MDPLVTAAMLGVPNKSAFLRPMSKFGRTLLNDVLQWAYQYTGKCYPGVVGPAVKCYCDFADLYNQAEFDTICHKYNTSKYISAITKHCKPNTKDSLLSSMLLRPTCNDVFDGVELRPDRCGDLSIPRSAELYNWVTRNFLNADFTIYDLDKLASLGSGEYDIQQIKDIATDITDEAKHTIPYLYAVVVSTIERDGNIRARQQSMDAKSEARLRLLYDKPGKAEFVVADKADDWKRAREWADILSDMKDIE